MTVVADPDAEPLPPHSGMGIASFVIALLSGLSVVLMVVVALVFLSTPGIDNTQEESPINYLLGTWIFASGVLGLVGIVFGIGGVLQKDRRRKLAIAGLLLNIFLPIGLMFLLLLGLTLERQLGTIPPSGQTDPNFGVGAVSIMGLAGFAIIMVIMIVRSRRDERKAVAMSAALGTALGKLPTRGCPRCNKTLPVATSFCRRCGHSLEEI